MSYGDGTHNICMFSYKNIRKLLMLLFDCRKLLMEKRVIAILNMRCWRVRRRVIRNVIYVLQTNAYRSSDQTFHFVFCKLLWSESRLTLICFNDITMSFPYYLYI